MGHRAEDIGLNERTPILALPRRHRAITRLRVVDKNELRPHESTIGQRVLKASQRTATQRHRLDQRARALRTIDRREDDPIKRKSKMRRLTVEELKAHALQTAISTQNRITRFGIILDEFARRR